jgi:hypothetical protein
VTEERYVAFADVLGFKDLVRNNSHENLLRIYNGSLSLAAEYAASSGRPAADPASGTPIEYEVNLSTVNVRVVSDSVILWTDESRPPEFVALVMALTNLLGAAMASEIPLRAALAFGALAHQTKSYNTSRISVDSLVGLGLVDAYTAESEQQWSGGYVLPAALDHYRATAAYGAPTIDQIEAAGWLTRYPVPLKDDRRVDAYAINWMRPIAGTDLAGAVRTAFEAWGKGTSEADVRLKIDNTIAFSRHRS